MAQSMTLSGALFKANLRIWGRCWTGRRRHWTFPRLTADQAPPSSRRRSTASWSGAAPPLRVSPALSTLGSDFWLQSDSGWSRCLCEVPRSLRTSWHCLQVLSGPGRSSLQLDRSTVVALYFGSWLVVKSLLIRICDGSSYRWPTCQLLPVDSNPVSLLVICMYLFLRSGFNRRKSRGFNWQVMRAYWGLSDDTGGPCILWKMAKQLTYKAH